MNPCTQRQQWANLIEDYPAYEVTSGSVPDTVRMRVCAQSDEQSERQGTSTSSMLHRGCHNSASPILGSA